MRLDTPASTSRTAAWFTGAAPRPRPGQRVDEGEEVGKPGGMERHPAVVALAASDGPGVVVEDLGITLVEDRERPVCIDVGVEEEPTVEKGEGGEEEGRPPSGFDSLRILLTHREPLPRASGNCATNAHPLI